MKKIMFLMAVVFALIFASCTKHGDGPIDPTKPTNPTSKDSVILVLNFASNGVYIADLRFSLVDAASNIFGESVGDHVHGALNPTYTFKYALAKVQNFVGKSLTLNLGFTAYIKNTDGSEQSVNLIAAPVAVTLVKGINTISVTCTKQ
jgi:hypothetical protein